MAAPSSSPFSSIPGGNIGAVTGAVFAGVKKASKIRGKERQKKADFYNEQAQTQHASNVLMGQREHAAGIMKDLSSHQGQQFNKINFDGMDSSFYQNKPAPAAKNTAAVGTPAPAETASPAAPATRTSETQFPAEKPARVTKTKLAASMSNSAARPGKPINSGLANPFTSGNTL